MAVHIFMILFCAVSNRKPMFLDNRMSVSVSDRCSVLFAKTAAVYARTFRSVAALSKPPRLSLARMLLGPLLSHCNALHDMLCQASCRDCSFAAMHARISDLTGSTPTERTSVGPSREGTEAGMASRSRRAKKLKQPPQKPPHSTAAAAAAGVGLKQTRSKCEKGHDPSKPPRARLNFCCHLHEVEGLNFLTLVDKPDR